MTEGVLDTNANLGGQLTVFSEICPLSAQAAFQEGHTGFMLHPVFPIFRHVNTACLPMLLGIACRRIHSPCAERIARMCRGIHTSGIRRALFQEAQIQSFLELKKNHVKEFLLPKVKVFPTLLGAPGVRFNFHAWMPVLALISGQNFYPGQPRTDTPYPLPWCYVLLLCLLGTASLRWLQYVLWLEGSWHRKL